MYTQKELFPKSSFSADLHYALQMGNNFLKHPWNQHWLVVKKLDIFFENWAQVRFTAALKAFTTVRNIIVEKKIEYDNRTSLSDDESSNGSYASYVQKKQRKWTWMRNFTSLPTCHALFFAFDSILGMFQKVIAPLQSIMKVDKKWTLWKQFFLGIHVGTGHSKLMNYDSM